MTESTFSAQCGNYYMVKGSKQMQWIFHRFKFHFSFKTILVILLILAVEGLVGLIVYKTGGTIYVYSYFMFVPVIISGFLLGFPMVLPFAVVGGLILGPKMPLYVAENIPQLPQNWLIRMGFLCLVGGLVGMLRGTMVEYYTRWEKYLTIDPFTGLQNRNSFFETNDEKIKNVDSYALLLIEIKNQNDIITVFGFEYFADLVNHIAKELEHDLNLESPLFSIRLDLLAFSCKSRIDPCAEKVIEYFKKPILIREIPIFCDVVIGVSNFPEDGSSTVELVQTALVAINHAKARHKPMIRFSSNEKRKRPVIHLISQIDTAIKSGNLDFHYQPVFTSIDKRPIAIEALVRWQHPEYGLITPFEYIDYLESTNLVNELTYWGLELNAKRLAELRAECLDVSMGLNISPTNLQQEDFSLNVEKILTDCKVSGRQFIFEITERGLLTIYDEVIRNLRDLHELGLRLSIDDFGTGNTSIDSFSRFHVDSIKIDRTFITNIKENMVNRNIVMSLIMMARNLNMHTIAEGIESKESSDDMVALGVDYLQGFYLCKPMNYSDLKIWLIKNYKKMIRI